MSVNDKAREIFHNASELPNESSQKRIVQRNIPNNNHNNNLLG